LRFILIARVLLATLGFSTLGAEAQEAPRPIPVALPPSILGVVTRAFPAAGEIVAAKGGEEVLFVAERRWRPALVSQAVLAGDTLRTGAIGTLALLFSDRTQMRVGRNSTLVVKAATAVGPTELSLTEGAVWARAERGGGAVIIDTPAATTAIRGTDWSVNVDGARTTLTVFEGVVEMTNPQGTLTVSAGEAAVATIGGAPTRVYGVNPTDRQQMHFYRTLRGVFEMLPASPLGRREMRAVRVRLEAIPPAARTVEEWLTLAEVSLAVTGRQVAAAALAEARARPLAPAQQARANLLDGLIAGSELRYREAQRLFEAAEPRLDGRRRASAVYGRFFAAALADPTAAVDPPSEGLAATDPYAALARAWLAGFTDGPEAELESLRAAEARFPYAVVLPAERVQAAQLLDRREEMREAAERARAIDPDDSLTLYAESVVASHVIRDADLALEKARAAAATAPGDSAAWNEVGIAEAGRDAVREAAVAFDRAIEADPQNAVAYANYASWLLDRNRPREAKPVIDSALTLDPTIAAVYDNLGRYYIQTGDEKLAVETLLKATAIDPASSASLRDLAIALYQAGERQQAIQQIDNAHRLDPNDPLPAVIRSGMAVDQLDPDTAIRSAREAMQRYRERADYFSGSLAFSRKSGSFLQNPYRMLTLNAWGRYYGDLAFDPFEAPGYFDQAIADVPDPFAIRSAIDAPDLGDTLRGDARRIYFQGLLLEPLALSARNRWTDFLKRPFTDVTASLGTPVRDENHFGTTGSVTVEGFDNATVPFAYLVSADGIKTEGARRNDELVAQGMQVQLGLAPTLFDRVVFLAEANKADLPLPGQASFPTRSDQQQPANVQATLGWSHTFGHHNVLSAAVAASAYSDRTTNIFCNPACDLTTIADQRSRGGALEAAVAHLIQIGAVTVRSGVEFGGETSDTKLTWRDYPGNTPPPIFTRANTDGLQHFARLYVDGIWKVSSTLQIEAGAFGTLVSDSNDDALDPRIGIAWTPVEGHWLRAMERVDTETGANFTLSPITTFGLTPNPVPLLTGGDVDTVALRWDAEWTERFFTSVEYQHQTFSRFYTQAPNILSNLAVPQGRLDRLSVAANIWLGRGFGAFANTAWTESENTSGGFNDGAPLPLVPDFKVTGGLSFAHPSGFQFTVVESYVGERSGARFRYMLDPYATTDLIASWQSPDRHLQVDFSVYNLLDRQHDVALDIPGPGRTFLASLRAKF
jgi:tetratricopeptide (TPR) repeat protein